MGNLYDVRSWPQAGRSQLEKALLKGLEKHLDRCLSGQVQSTKTQLELSAELLVVRQKLARLDPA
jgi:hypothetical protein